MAEPTFNFDLDSLPDSPLTAEEKRLADRTIMCGFIRPAGSPPLEITPEQYDEMFALWRKLGRTLTDEEVEAITGIPPYLPEPRSLLRRFFSAIARAAFWRDND